jgi:hypothetical protein
MELKFEVTIKCRAMNEMSIYERLRNAIFDWQTTEPNVKTVEVLPIKKARTRPSTRAEEKCPECGGDGYISSYPKRPPDAQDCINCNGTGHSHKP